MADDLVEEAFAETNLAVKEQPFVGLALVPPELPSVGDGRGNELLAVLVDQLDMTMTLKEPRERRTQEVGSRQERESLYGTDH